MGETRRPTMRAVAEQLVAAPPGEPYAMDRIICFFRPIQQY